MPLVTGVAGALTEAWTELRIHRGRVLLSLIGVAVAVCALTSVIAAGAILEKATIENAERSAGRPATLYLAANSSEPSASSNSTDLESAWQQTLARYKIRYASRSISGTQRVQFATGTRDVNVTAVDQPYATMHRIDPVAGVWFTSDDIDRLAPPLVINEVFWRTLGAPALKTHPTVTLIGPDTTITGVVIGVTKASLYDTEPSMYMLTDAYARTAPAMQPEDGTSTPNYEMWVPESIATRLAARIRTDIRGELGSGSSVVVDRQDYAVQPGDPFGALKVAVSAVAALVLLLGTLNLLNIALITVRQRIREIGIRRSFGASSLRVFFTVMMESVVATTVAGVIGVLTAVLLSTNQAAQEFLSQGQVEDFPPFPIDAALLGLGSSVLVGALAGLVPAIVAVRVRVIDAIRY